MSASETSPSASYRASGVDIDLAHDLLGGLKQRLAAATRPEVLAPVGGFGGLFALDLGTYRDPVLVTSIDGVGTKLMVAALAGCHETVGFDIVHHCINDVAVQGAEPVYFLDYLGIGRLRSPLYEEVLSGVAEACRRQNVALLGGETAEMPGMYGEHYDLVGCISGVVERDALITGERIRAGHAVLGLASNGLHTNGYSLARQVLFETAGWTVATEPEGLDCTVGEALLAPHVCYWPAIRAALEAEIPLDGMAHITGGGLYDNIPRVLPDGTAVTLDAKAWSTPPIFGVIAEQGAVEAREMHRVFNMGVGMVWLLPEHAVADARDCCRSAGIESWIVGAVTGGDGRVTIENLDG